MQNFRLTEQFITLCAFLKVTGLVSSGGETKLYMQTNKILVNGVLCHEKRKKLYRGDVVLVGGNEYKMV
jgi:ribosome-associated protein